MSPSLHQGSSLVPGDALLRYHFPIVEFFWLRTTILSSGILYHPRTLGLLRDYSALTPGSYIFPFFILALWCSLLSLPILDSASLFCSPTLLLRTLFSSVSHDYFVLLSK